MAYTVFDTPIIKNILRLVSLIILKVTGWRKEGRLPFRSKYVIIAAPHTSNWDFFYVLLFSFAFKVKAYWMGKDTIFKKPFGNIMKWLGGIPVHRNKFNNLVQETIDQFKTKNKLALIIPPEGTRAQVKYWRTGFYHIALGADVPILLGFLDYKRKTGGLGPLFYPTGDINLDMQKIQNFYSKIKGKYTEKFNKYTEVIKYKKEKKCS